MACGECFSTRGTNSALLIRRLIVTLPAASATISFGQAPIKHLRISLPFSLSLFLSSPFFSFPRHSSDIGFIRDGNRLIAIWSSNLAISFSLSPFILMLMDLFDYTNQFVQYFSNLRSSFSLFEFIQQWQWLRRLIAIWSSTLAISFSPSPFILMVNGFILGVIFAIMFDRRYINHQWLDINLINNESFFPSFRISFLRHSFPLTLRCD